MASVNDSQPDLGPRSRSSAPTVPPKSLLHSTWQVLEQPPTPSLQEIMSANSRRGDCDREVLIALLTAKSAEDTRISSIAALHRSMLDHYHARPCPPLQPSRNARHLENLHSDPNSLPLFHPYPPQTESPRSCPAQSYPPYNTYPHLPLSHPVPSSQREQRQASAPVSAARPRKRSRTSHSPPPATSLQLSHPGPYVRDYSATRLTTSQGSMAISSLLSAREEPSDPHMNGTLEPTSASVREARDWHSSNSALTRSG